MNKLLATCAAIAVTAFVMLPGAAGAAERDANGLRNAEQIEVSAQRYRRYSGSRRYYGRSYGRRHYYGGSYYARPAYGYGDGYGYSRGPGWGPAPFPFVFGLPY